MPWTRFVTLSVLNAEKEGDSSQIMWEDGQDEPSIIGDLDLVTSKQLESLRTIKEVTFFAILSPEWLESARKNQILNDASVNILGPRCYLDQAGRLLADKCAYLQHPLYLDRGIPYFNPQYFYTGSRQDLSRLVGPSMTSELDKQKSRLRQGLDDTLEYLDSSASLIDSSETTIDTHVLVTPLKPSVSPLPAVLIGPYIFPTDMFVLILL